MALIVCPECGNHVSSVARRCPMCGYPMGIIIKGEMVSNILLDAAIEQLNLSVSTYNGLRLSGIKTVRDLCKRNVYQLIEIDKLGKKSAEEIMSRLLDLGIRLREVNANEKSSDFIVPVTKYDWRCERAPKNVVISSFEYAYKPYELDILKLGFRPTNMDQKWFCYYESGTVHFYRSWSGILVCRVILNETSNKHIVLKYYKDDEEKVALDYLDAQELIRCVIDGSWGW